MKRPGIYDGKAHSGAPCGAVMGSGGRVSHHPAAALIKSLFPLKNQITGSCWPAVSPSVAPCPRVRRPVADLPAYSTAKGQAQTYSDR
jgi:hypothetical protein